MIIKETVALLLTAVLCTGLCTGFTVNAGEPGASENKHPPELDERLRCILK